MQGISKGGVYSRSKSTGMNGQSEQKDCIIHVIVKGGAKNILELSIAHYKFNALLIGIKVTSWKNVQCHVLYVHSDTYTEKRTCECYM